MWSGRETDKKAADIQARLFMARTLDEIGKKCQAEEKHKWASEKPKLDNARRLRGIHFIDPEDKEFKETIKNARRKLETPVAPAMPCKISKNNQNWVTRGKSNEIKSKLACILEASGSTRLRVGESLPNHHEDHIVGKETIHCSVTTWYTNLFLMPQAMKIPAARAAMDKQWEKLEKISAWNLTKVRSKKEVIDEARTKGAKVHFASLIDICHLKNAELETKAPKIQRKSCASRRHCERWFWILMQYSLRKDHQHHKWRQQRSWISCPDCQGAQDKQLTQYLLIPR